MVSDFKINDVLKSNKLARPTKIMKCFSLFNPVKLYTLKKIGW